jgi:hypothetical protein
VNRTTFYGKKCHFKDFSCSNLSGVFKDTFLFNETKVFVVNWLQCYKLNTFLVAPSTISENVKMCCSNGAREEYAKNCSINFFTTVMNAKLYEARFSVSQLLPPYSNICR